jgi:hypothetical protein
MEERERERIITFEMNYCRHYRRGYRVAMECEAGMDLGTTQVVPIGEGGHRIGPCIEGHTLVDPLKHCPHWIRQTREEGENRADEIEHAESCIRRGVSACCEAPIDESRVITSGRHKGHGPRICSRCWKIVFMV